MPAPINYVVPQPQVSDYFNAMRQGRADRQAQQADVRQTALSKYLPGALQGDQAAQGQAMQNATPDQAIALSGHFGRMDAQTIAKQRDHQARMGSLLMAVQNKQISLDQAKQIAIQDGFPAEKAAQITEDQLPGLIAQNQTVAEQLDQAYKAKTLANDTSRTTAQNASSNASADASRAQAAKDRASASRGPQVRAPANYQYVIDENGQQALQFIPNGPADPANKPLTEKQSQSAGFAGRLIDSDSKLGNTAVSGALLSGTQDFRNSIPLVSNALISSDRQRGNQARTNFTTAKLREESGASIPVGEYASSDQTYIPVYGDEPDVLAAKNTARKQAIYNMWVQAGPQYKEDAADAKKAFLQAKSEEEKLSGGAKVTIDQLPPPGQRTIGKMYPTPRGDMKWTGRGWLPAGAQ